MSTRPKTHVLTLIVALIFCVPAVAGESSPNGSNLATIFDSNVTSCSVEKARTHPYVAKVELKVSETASRQYVFFENGEGMVTLEDGTTASLSLKETAAFFGYSEKTFTRDPRAHIMVAAGSWTGVPGVLSITASIDSQLLDLIDQHAPNYFNPLWNMNISQYKAWIATIAWAEGVWGGYGAHSTGSPGSDLFYHRYGGYPPFTFSTGIGPFQLDNGSDDNWQNWRTIDKLDPEQAVLSVLSWHRQHRWDSDLTLANFAAEPPPGSDPWRWYALNTPGERRTWWGQVTGQDNWLTHAYGNVSLDWPMIKATIAQRATDNGTAHYSYNVEDKGLMRWTIRADEGIRTESNKSVVFDGYYPTWLIRSRTWGGTTMFRYYYAYRDDVPVEVWLLDNSGNPNAFKYIFIREWAMGSLGQFPDHRSGNYAGEPMLSSPAIITGAVNPPTAPVKQIPANNAPVTNPNITLSWTASTDPDGGTVKYNVVLNTDGSVLVQNWNNVTTTSVSYILPSTNGTNYYWQVWAIDDEGSTTEAGSWFFFWTDFNVPPVDLNNDGIVNFGDFAIFAFYCMDATCSEPDWCEGADIDMSGQVDCGDLRIIAEHWLAGFVDGPQGMVFVYINDPGVSGHEGFIGEMSKYETTNAQYCEYLNAAFAANFITVYDDRVYAASDTSHSQIYFDTYAATSDSQITYSVGTFSVRSRDGYSMANHPVVEVSWYGATAFCEYYGYRLPTEWEWQAVADYDGSYTYGCGPTINHSKATYDRYNPLSLSSYPYTSPVNHYSSYGYGMNDMAGNVWEWTSSRDPSIYSNRIIRSGGWFHGDGGCTVSYRSSYFPYSTRNDYGFRVCR